MAALLDTRRLTPGQSPEPQMDGSPQATLPERNWNPLLVPTEMYLREGLVWQPQQPVSLTVEVNGKRDLMKYAAVMQLVPKQGFVARLGQPGAAAKFQNLHLVDVKRRGSTDVHICLGDLAWTRSRASEVSVTAALVPAAMPSSGAASLEISDAAPEACVIGGGAAEGGLLSGSSSEGTTTAQAGGRSTAATEIDVNAGDSRSPGDAGSDQDEKTAMTSAVGRSADAQTSSSAAAAAAPLVDTTATAVAAPVVSDDAGAAGTPASSAAKTLLSYRCGYAFCPCHLDPDQLDAAPAERHFVNASPHGSVVADRQMCFGRSSTPASGRPSCVAGPAADAPGARQPSPASDASAGGGITTHMSRERLRNLCLPAMRRSVSSVALPKATATGPSDGGRAGGLATLPSIAAASLPPLRSAQGSVSASAAAGGIWVGAGAVADTDTGAAPGAGGVVVAGGLIDRELVLPAALAANRMMDKHALVHFEIDGEYEDCRVQYRLVRSDDGRTLTLQGISRPLRGLQLLSLSEAADGDLFIRAATPCAAPRGDAFASAPAAAPALVPMVAAAPTAAAVGPTAAAAADTAPMLSRSSSGRQRRPSLKAREGAEEAAGTGVGAGGRTGSAGSAPALAPLCPMQSASGEPLASAVLQQLQFQNLQQQQQLMQQSVQQSKRRGRPPKSRLPSSPPPLPRYPQQQLQQQQQQQQMLHQFHQQQRLLDSSYTTGGDMAMGEQMQDSHDGYDDHTLGFGGSAKRSRTAAAAGRAASSSMISQDGISVKEEHDDAAPVGWRGAPLRGRRAVAAEATPPLPPASLPPFAFAVGGGATAVALAHGRARNTSNTGSAPSLPPLVILNRGEFSPPVKTSAEMDDEEFGGQRQQAWQLKQQQPHTGPANLARAAASADSPIGGRGGRKRVSAASPGPAAAGVAVAKAPVEPSPKRARVSRGDSFQGVMAADGGSGDDIQPLLQLQRESPQGSEAAAAAGPALPRGRRSSNTRALRAAARRTQPQQSRRQVSPPPSYSSAEDDLTDADEVDGGERGLSKSSAAPAGAGIGEEVAAGVEGGDGLLCQAAALMAAAAAAGAAASRHKARGRVSTGKSKGKPNRHPSKISNVIRNAGAILLMIGHSPMMYEKQLRATFGNNPDTSKALRLLEEQGKVMRGGLGYRMHPYHYTLTPVGRKEYERLLAEKGPSHAFALTMGIGLPSGSEEDSPAAGEGEDDDDNDAAPAGEDEETGGEAGASAAVAEGGAAAPVQMETGAQSEAPAAVPQQQQQQQQQLKQEPHAAPMLTTGFCGVQQPASAGESPGPSAMQVDYPGRGAAAAAAAAAIAGLAPQPSGTCESGSSRQQATATTAAALPPARPLLPQLSAATGTHGGTPASGAAAAAAAGWCAGGGGGSSPSASTHSVQLFDQARPLGGGAAAAMCGGLVPTSGSSVGTLAARPPPQQQQQPQQQVLLLQLHPTHPHAISTTAGDQNKQFATAGNGPVSAAVASAAAPTAANAGTAPQQYQQAMYACPVGYQLSYPPAYQLAPQGGVNPDQDPTAQAASGQVPYGNPYAVYGYVPTPFGYMPCAMYSAYAPAGGAAAAGVGAGAGNGIMPAPMMMTAPPGGMAPVPAASGAQPAAMMSAACTATYMQAYTGMAFPAGGQPAAAAAAGAQAQLVQSTLAPPPPSQFAQRQQQQQQQAQYQTVVPAAQTQAGLPAAAEQVRTQTEPQLQPAALVNEVPVVAPPAQPQPEQLPQATGAPAMPVVQQPPQQQQPQQQPAYRYVVEMPGGGWRAEVPSAAGVLYYSPGFASAMQAAAAADLLASKLRPGEPLNLGIHPQEAATLSCWSVEQVQATLWNMADQR